MVLGHYLNSLLFDAVAPRVKGALRDMGSAAEDVGQAAAAVQKFAEDADATLLQFRDRANAILDWIEKLVGIG
jgi:hypothetical protein